MKRVFASLGVAIFVAKTSLSGLASAAADASDEVSTTVDSIGDYVVVKDLSGSPRAVASLKATVDELNRTVRIEIGDRNTGPLYVLLKEGWVRSFIPNPAFSNATFAFATNSDTRWFRVAVEDPVAGLSFDVSEFRPELDKSFYSMGSPSSILLKRPMLVTLSEVPRFETETLKLSNDNGTWLEEVPVSVRRLGISFEDADASGQTVAINRTWLGQYGLSKPYFQYADGTSIANKSDDHHFYLFPPHFSILYVFTNDESFTKEDNQARSDVHWDSGGRNIYILADRRDPTGTNERMRSPAPVTYDQTTSFTVRATWKIAQKGHWQYAVPVFFMAASNTRVDMANSVYVHYSSRDSSPSHPWYTPWYYLRYQDSTGTLRVNYLVDAPANTQYEFMLAYDAYTRRVTLGMYYADGTQLASVGYTLGAGESFSLGKVGAGAWGYSSSSEQRTIAATDNIYFDATMARNGNFEVDGNGDNVPDHWQKWTWSDGDVYRSSARAKFGTWSVKIPDLSSRNDYGLQTTRMTAVAGQSFLGSAWVYVSSGWNAICIEFWDFLAGGTRLAVACKNTAWTLLWEYLDITALAPTGTGAVDLILYSVGSNTGTGYFDGAGLRLKRSFWAISNHWGEPGLPPDLDGWRIVFDRAAELGASYVRTDYRWDWFEHVDDEEWDPGWLSTWHSIVDLGKTRGIDLIVILNGPKPSWVTDANKYVEFYEFCKKMGQEFGRDVYYYQVLNEHNWNQEVAGSLPTFASYCFTGLVEGEGVASWDHKSSFKTIVNVLADMPNWDPTLRDWLTAAGSAIDIPAIDHYPATKPGAGNCDNWAPLDALFRIMRDPNYKKEGAIMETGYSSWMSPGHTEQDQENWVNCALPIIRDMTTANNRDYPTTPLLLSTWYELVDHATTGLGGELDHYGILRTGTLTEKPAYDDFRSRIPEFKF